MIEHLKRMHLPQYPSLFRTMHTDRKRIFVDALRWDIPHDGTQEVDQYDNDRAHYLILRDSNSQQHLGSVRLLPTTAPHMLDDVFPFLCEGEVPRGPKVWEITRLLVSPDLGRRERMPARNMLARAMIEFGLMMGIEKFTAVCEIGFLTQLLAAGWRIDPLGLPQQVAGSLIGAVLIHVEAEFIAKTTEGWRHPGPVLRLRYNSTSLAA